MLKIGGFFKEKQEWLYRYNRLLFSVHKLVNTLLGKLLLLKGMAAIQRVFQLFQLLPKNCKESPVKQKMLTIKQKQQLNEVLQVIAHSHCSSHCNKKSHVSGEFKKKADTQDPFVTYFFRLVRLPNMLICTHAYTYIYLYKENFTRRKS